MNLLKGHIGRRVAGVAVAATLLVLGLEAPAFGADPTISSFTPTSGPAGCVVTITGTNFDNPTVSAVKFNGTAAASFDVVSPTQILAEAPATVSTGKIAVTNATSTATSTADFTVPASGSGGCAPTITSFTPTCGPIGTSVAITGTNLFDTATTAGTVKFNGTTATSTTAVSPTDVRATVPTGATTGTITVATGVATATSSTSFTVATSCVTITSFTPTSGPVGTQVTITGTGFTGATAVSFNNVNATTFSVVSATQIKATVPTGATTGPIKVTVPGGSATSSTNFTVSTVHARSVTLRLRKHLVARGTVSVADTTTACVASVPVKIQRRASGHWKTVGRTTTTSTGSYKKRVRDIAGKYRAKAPRVTLNSGVDVCAAAKSPIRRNT